MSHAFNVFRMAGDMLHVASIFLLWTKVQKSRSCAGLSLKSQLLFFVVYVTRYLDLFVFLGHPLGWRPVYNFIMKCLFIGSQAAVLYYMWYRFRPTYNAKLDSVRVELILLPCVVLAYFFLNGGGPRRSALYFIREVRPVPVPAGHGLTRACRRRCSSTFGRFPSC